jgi:hypothetical protein
MSTHHIHIRASRRRFLQFMAASPLFARSALAEGIVSGDTRIAMQQLGAPTLKDITPEMVRRV